MDSSELNALRAVVSLREIIALDVALAFTSEDKWTGFCPFHHDKIPSFMVSDRHQIFHCFGCGGGGDIFGWLMRKRGLSFLEAVESVRKIGKI